MYKTNLPLFASKEKHVGKKHYLFLHKDFDRSKKLSKNLCLMDRTFVTPCKVEMPLPMHARILPYIRNAYLFYTHKAFIPGVNDI